MTAGTRALRAPSRCALPRRSPGFPTRRARPTGAARSLSGRCAPRSLAALHPSRSPFPRARRARRGASGRKRPALAAGYKTIKCNSNSNRNRRRALRALAGILQSFARSGIL